MKEDFSELIEYLDKKFLNIDLQLGDLRENKVDKSDLENKADKLDVQDLMLSIDAYAKKADTYFQEMVMLSHKVDRHEKWLRQVAEKLDMKLDY